MLAETWNNFHGLELFTSEGSLSCSPADALLARLDPAGVIVLSEHVDYWSYIGWNEPYSSKALTERQRRYAEKSRIESVYTPQGVVDGTAEFVGSDGESEGRRVEGFRDREAESNNFERRKMDCGCGCGRSRWRGVFGGGFERGGIEGVAGGEWRAQFAACGGGEESGQNWRLEARRSVAQRDRCGDRDAAHRGICTGARSRAGLGVGDAFEPAFQDVVELVFAPTAWNPCGAGAHRFLSSLPTMEPAQIFLYFD